MGVMRKLHNTPSSGDSNPTPFNIEALSPDTCALTSESKIHKRVCLGAI